MSSYCFDPQRFVPLKNGEVVPANRGEELFVLAYQWGASDQDLFSLLIHLNQESETMNVVDWAYLCTGYALAEAEFRYVDILEHVPNKSKKIH